ncbi:hypothetical protein IJ670_01295 [bacterium]|nr:hypothetical protein [bacterium]
MLWANIFKFIPGADGIRVASRFSFCALILFSFGIANFIKSFSSKKYKILVVFAILLISLEHIAFTNDPNSGWETYSWSKSAFQQQISNALSKIPKNAKIVYFDDVKYNVINPNTEYMQDQLSGCHIALQVLAMWASIQSQKYTMNGTTGVSKDTKALLDNFNVTIIPMYFDMKTFDYHKYLLGK